MPALVTLTAASAPAATAATGWGKPFEFTKPGSLDLIPAQLAFAPGGGAAAAFGIEDVDTPGSSQAYVTSRSAAGAVRRRGRSDRLSRSSASASTAARWSC